MITHREAWLEMLDFVLANDTRWGRFSLGGALPPHERKMDPRCGDYGAGWNGDGLEANAHLSAQGGMFFDNRNSTGVVQTGRLTEPSW